MAGDRTIAPTPARMHRAWREGLRPGHVWMAAAVAVWAVTAVIARTDAPPRGLDAWRAELSSAGVADVAVLAPALWDAVVLAGVIAGAALAGWLAVGIVTGSTGPVRRGQNRLRPAPRNRALDALWIPLAGLAVAGFVLVVAGVIAGAARAPGASFEGLYGLWWGWVSRTGSIAGGVLFAAGLVELAIERWRIGRRLYASPEDLREERARAGGRSR